MARVVYALATRQTGAGRRYGSMTHTRQAPAEVSDDLVDHRRLGDLGGEAHRAVAGRTRQRGVRGRSDPHRPTRSRERLVRAHPRLRLTDQRKANEAAQHQLLAAIGEPDLDLVDLARIRIEDLARSTWTAPPRVVGASNWRTRPV